MPGRITELSETQIVADLRNDRRRQAAATTSVQMPQPAKDTFTVATNGQPSTWQLNAIPYQGTGGSSLNLSWNGEEIIEGVDYTVDYTTAIVTFSSAQQALLRATPTPADVLTADYWTTGDLIALSGPLDTGTISDNFNRANSTTTVNPASDGGTWTSDGATLKGITSNQAMIVGGSGGPTERMRRDLGSSGANVSIKVQQGTFGGGTIFYTYVSYDPAADTGYIIFYYPYGPIEVRRWNSGAYGAVLGSTTGTVWQNTNTLADLNVIYNATTATVTIKQGGVTLTTVTDPGGANGTGTWVGFAENGGYAATVTSWDDFTAAPA